MVRAKCASFPSVCIRVEAIWGLMAVLVPGLVLESLSCSPGRKCRVSQSVEYSGDRSALSWVSLLIL